MKKRISIVILVGLVALAAGCGPPSLAQYGARRITREVRGIKFDAFQAEPMRGDLSAYNRLEVEPLQNEMEDRVPAELVASLNEQLFRQLSQVKHFEVVRTPPPDDASAGVATASETGKQSMSPTAPRPRAVILRGSIMDFDAGKQSLRVLQAGVGRQGMLTLHLRFVDGATGEVLGKYVVNSEVLRLGGNSSAGVDKLAKGVGELVAKVVKQQSPKTASRTSPEKAQPAERKGKK